jgi:autoinducer 2-degrading protein
MPALVNFVSMQVDADIVDDFRAAITANARGSRAEAGCLQFDVSVAKDDPGHFILYEKFESEAALDSHRETPHFQAYWKFLEAQGDKMKRTPRHYAELEI